MFYGPLEGSITKTKLLIRETHCASWGEASGEYVCTACESGYLPTSEGVCVPC